MRLKSTIAAMGMLLVSTAHPWAADLFTTEQPPAPPPEERGIWAAIAYSAPDEKYGFFWGADKRQEAMDIALKHCERDKGKSCVVVSVFRNHRHWDDDEISALRQAGEDALELLSRHVRNDALATASETSRR